MPDWISVVLLGIIEGITEFLPVSSTGHLLIAEHWLGKKSDLFNVVIQSGAVIAVLAVFAKRAQALAFGWSDKANRDYLLKLSTAFLLTAAGGIVMSKLGMKLPKNVAPIAWATLIGGILFVAVEIYLRGRKTSDEITWTIAIAIGLAQLVAVAFPGASRSGTTILFALILGLSRSSAAEFSFLLGIPTLLAAGAKETFEALKDNTAHEPWGMIFLGTIVSAITAFVVVKWLLGYVRNHTFTPFGWYRIVVGVAILLILK